MEKRNVSDRRLEIDVDYLFFHRERRQYHRRCRGLYLPLCDELGAGVVLCFARKKIRQGWTVRDALEKLAQVVDKQHKEVATG